MSDWRPYEPCREHEEQARRERDGAADDAMFEPISMGEMAAYAEHADALRASMPKPAPLAMRAAELRERIKGLR